MSTVRAVLWVEPSDGLTATHIIGRLVSDAVEYRGKGSETAEGWVAAGWRVVDARASSRNSTDIVILEKDVS